MAETESTNKTFGMLAQFADPEALMHGCVQVRATRSCG